MSESKGDPASESAKPDLKPAPEREGGDVIVSAADAIDEIRAGRMVILVDDEDRENEGDLCMAAEMVTPEAINFMAKFGRGLICLPMVEEQLEKLRLSMMVPDAENSSGFGTAFTISIEAREGVTTGISAHDRAHTILTAIRDDVRPQDIVRPGHVFPLRARGGGVLRRAGQTEGSVDLARLAGLKPAGVICEIMNDDGSMARMPDLIEFAREHGLKIVTVADLIEHRLRTERLVRPAGEAELPSRFGGDFRAIVYENDIDHVDHIALVKGEIKEDEPVLVRVHSECLTGDAFGSMRCDCGEQLATAMKMIELEGSGDHPLHAPGRPGHRAQEQDPRLRPPGQRGSRHRPGQREAGLRGRRPGLRRRMPDPPRSRRPQAAASSRTTRASASPSKATACDIVERVALEMQPNEKNFEYLRTKKEKLGHVLHA